VLPGACFWHITKALNATPRNNSVKLDCIYVQVGINHRHEKCPPTTEIQTMLQELNSVYQAPIVLMGVSYPMSMPEYQRENIDKLNRELRHSKAANIAHLRSQEVRVRGDQLHHTKDTVDKAVQMLINHHAEQQHRQK